MGEVLKVLIWTVIDKACISVCVPQQVLVDQSAIDGGEMDSAVVDAVAKQPELEVALLTDFNITFLLEEVVVPHLEFLDVLHVPHEGDWASIIDKSEEGRGAETFTLLADDSDALQVDMNFR